MTGDIHNSTRTYWTFEEECRVYQEFQEGERRGNTARIREKAKALMRSRGIWEESPLALVD